jgi:hypothetical protein
VVLKQLDQGEDPAEDVAENNLYSILYAWAERHGVDPFEEYQTGEDTFEILTEEELLDAVLDKEFIAAREETFDRVEETLYDALAISDSPAFVRGLSVAMDRVRTLRRPSAVAQPVILPDADEAEERRRAHGGKVEHRNKSGWCRGSGGG